MKQFHEYLVDFAESKKCIRKLIHFLYILGIVLIVVFIILLIISIIFSINYLMNISLLLIGISCCIMSFQKFYDTHKFEKNNPHVKLVNRYGLALSRGYTYLSTGVLIIFVYIMIKIIDG